MVNFGATRIICLDDVLQPHDHGIAHGHVICGALDFAVLRSGAAPEDADGAHWRETIQDWQPHSHITLSCVWGL